MYSRLHTTVSAAGTLLFVLALAMAEGCKGHAEISGEVISVADGDTIRVLDADRRQHKIRLAWIDAPERHMAFGSAARKALSARVWRQQVSVEVIDTDRYGRHVGLVRLGDQDVNLLQLSEGWAWHYQFYARKSQSAQQYQRYAEAEKNARFQRIGLWRDSDAIAPWQWRRNQRNSNAGDESAASVDTIAPAAE